MSESEQAEQNIQDEKLQALLDKVEGISEELAACRANAVELNDLGLADRILAAMKALSK